MEVEVVAEPEEAKRANTFKLYALDLQPRIRCLAATLNVIPMVSCRTRKPRCLWARVGSWSPALEARSSMQRRIRFVS